MSNLEKQTQPSESEIREFWEWCGFKFKPIPYRSKPGFWEHEEYMVYPNGIKVRIYKGDYLPLDLNNLFKYPVPKLFDLGYWVRVTHTHLKYQSEEFHSICIGQHNFIEHGEYVGGQNFVLALFWVIYKCFGLGKN